ncbi:MAG: hydrogenase maturation protease [Candidatus Contendobacter sp.]|jgi:hydrogenase maturation protease|nr:hydrogenase maturation protease [Gammaproteobacteria bacterium]MCC8993588.1 hydrogenase maturation protease [Candidatus Contendobacter sp.]
MVRGVFCFGNPLHGDDGVGPRIAERLRQGYLPVDVRVVDAGSDGLALTTLLADCAAAVLVDAERSSGPAGQIAVLRLDPAQWPEPDPRCSHSADLGFALCAAHVESGDLPPIHLVTVTVSDFTPFRIGLSPVVARAVPLAVAAIARLLGWSELT